MRTQLAIVSLCALLASAGEARSEKGLPEAHDAGPRNGRFGQPVDCREIGPHRFATLNLLPGEVMLLHIDVYGPERGVADASCPIRLAFVTEEVVLQQDTYTLTPNRTLDVAFYGPATGVYEVHPVITPIGRCNLQIVPMLQVQEQVPFGTGKTLYIYPGQFSVPLENRGDVGSAEP